MKNLIFKNKTTLLIIFGAIVLAGIAIFTATSLYNSRQSSIAPTAPESKPAAQEATPIPDYGAVPSESCSLNLNVNTLVNIDCTNKAPYQNVLTNTSGNYDLSTPLDTQVPLDIGDRVVFVIELAPSATSDTITVTDTLPAGYDYVDSVSQCTYDNPSNVITCSVSSTDTLVAYRVEINDQASGNITNTASVSGQNSVESTCETTISIKSQSTPTPTPTATPTSTPAPSCNETCSTSADCASSNVCSGGLCRNPSCTNETDCVCDLATSTPIPTTPPELPDAGVGTPALVGTATGVILLLGALLLAL